MVTMAISDTHGKDVSNKLSFRINEYISHIDKVVFLGDYFDNDVENIPSETQLENFYKIITYKKHNPNIVKILIGNHDASYLLGGKALYNTRCFGYEKEIKKAIEDNIEMLDYCFFDGKYLYSHAGISKTMIKELGVTNFFELNEKLHNKDYSIFYKSKFGLCYRRLFPKEFEKFPNMNWEDLVKNKVDEKQVCGHYCSFGLHVQNDIYDIENPDHCNRVVFE